MARALEITERMKADGLRVSLPTQKCYLLVPIKSATFCYLLLSFSTCFYLLPPRATFCLPVLPFARDIGRIRAPGQSSTNPEREGESLYRGSTSEWDHRTTQTCSP